MSYHNTTPIDVTARKRHCCTWCGQKIQAGETYKRWTCIGDDGCLTTKMHQECRNAYDKYSAMATGEYEWDAYSFTRGCICESGDSGHGAYPECIKIDMTPANRPAPELAGNQAST